jgi:hypothetical protein
MACGPPIAARISGSVMNGPTPIMSSMFSATAPRSVSVRRSSGAVPSCIAPDGVCDSMRRVYPVRVTLETRSVDKVAIIRIFK